MRQDEIRGMLKLASGLFTDLNAEQIKLLAEQIRRFDKLTVETALKNHRVNHEFFSFSGFAEGVRSEHAKSQNRKKASKEERIIEWLKRTVEGARGLTNDDALREHFETAWNFVQADQEAEDQAKQLVRKLIRGHCARAFMEIGWGEKDAKEMASQCVGLEPGQKIDVKLSIFREVPAEPVAV